jgi:hypothetical protein
MKANTEHHKKLDELIENARETMHQMIDQAISSGAITEEMTNPYEYVLAKAVITIWGDKREYAPLDGTRKRDFENLSHFI